MHADTYNHKGNISSPFFFFLSFSHRRKKRWKKWWSHCQWRWRRRELVDTTSLRHHFPILATFQFFFIIFRWLRYHLNFKNQEIKEITIMDISSQDNNILTVVAVNKGKNSVYAVRWAIDNLLTLKHTLILLHVRTRRRYLLPSSSC